MIKIQIKIDLVVVLILMLDLTQQKEHFKKSKIAMMLPSRNSMETKAILIKKCICQNHMQVRRCVKEKLLWLRVLVKKMHFSMFEVSVLLTNCFSGRLNNRSMLLVP